MPLVTSPVIAALAPAAPTTPKIEPPAPLTLMVCAASVKNWNFPLPLAPRELASPEKLQMPKVLAFSFNDSVEIVAALAAEILLPTPPAAQVSQGAPPLATQLFNAFPVAAPTVRLILLVESVQVRPG